ncbi:MAG: hypothetical protein ABH873_02305 [Candidatus Firestonebacteria bacterium]
MKSFLYLLLLVAFVFAEEPQAQIDFQSSLKNIQERIDNLIKNNEEISKSIDKLILDKLTNEVEGFKVKFDIVNDEIKIKSDDIKSIRESISVLKKNLDSNIENTVECRKLINETLDQKDKEKNASIDNVLKWEYWGVVASGLAVIALILAIAK